MMMAVRDLEENYDNLNGLEDVVLEASITLCTEDAEKFPTLPRLSDNGQRVIGR